VTSAAAQLEAAAGGVGLDGSLTTALAEKLTVEFRGAIEFLKSKVG
jgi:hypothetical protein